MRESSGALLIFLDDDNVPASAYLERALRVLRSHPHIGVFGAGKLKPEFEAPPPRNIESLLPLLALRTVPSVRWSNHPADFSSIPWGAGRCVSREVAEACESSIDDLGVTSVLDRQGKELYAEGDDLFA